MVYPSQGREVKTAILEALEKHRSPDNGLGYNTLFDAVNSKVGGSRRTFHKYLSELVSSGAVRKEKDPRHKVGVTIYRTEAAKPELTLIELEDWTPLRTDLRKMHQIGKQVAGTPYDKIKLLRMQEEAIKGHIRILRERIEELISELDALIKQNEEVMEACKQEIAKAKSKKTQKK